MSRVIVIQGPSTYVSELKKAFEGYDIIWSTWVGEEHNYTTQDIVVYNEKPMLSGVQNIALQYKTTIEGIKKAKELGYTRVLKWRSDLVPNNPSELFKLFKEDSLNFLAWHVGGYFVDYFLEGMIDDVYNAWNIDTFYDEFSERITTNKILSTSKNFHFIMNELNDYNEILWVKRNVKLSSYKNNRAFTTYIK